VLKSGLLTLHNADGQVSITASMPCACSNAAAAAAVHRSLADLRDAPRWRRGGQLAGGVLLVVVLGLCWLARFHSIRLRWPREQGELLRYSGRSHPNVIFQEMLMRADYLFIGSMLPPRPWRLRHGQRRRRTAADHPRGGDHAADEAPAATGRRHRRTHPFALRLTAT
jgi:hypothetical protein